MVLHILLENNVYLDIKNAHFVFLDERSNKYYCKSAFKKEKIDYMRNQTPVTVLQKTKMVDGVPHILFTKEGYTPIEVAE